MDNAPNILCSRCKEQEESQHYFTFYCKLSKITLDLISELISLKYAFNIPFKITVQIIIMGNCSQFNDGGPYYPHLYNCLVSTLPSFLVHIISGRFLGLI